MPRLAARDTPAQRQLNIMSTISRRLDDLEDADVRARVLTWIDSLVDDTEGDEGERTRKVVEEIRAMKAIAAQFEGVSSDTREVVVRWLIQNYGNDTRPEDSEHSDVA